MLKGLLGDIKEKTGELYNDAAGSLASVTSKVVVSAESKIDMGISAAIDVYNGLGKTITSLTKLGLVFSMIAAPVPVVIGLALLYIMEDTKGETDTGLSNVESSANRAKKRDRERSISLLQKYGAIPTTATIETPLLIVYLDSVNESISGRVKSGKYKNTSLDNLDDGSIHELKLIADHESRQLIDAYTAYRTK